jgi:hypothetical protein
MNYTSIAVAVAGLIHLWLGPQHYSHAPVHGIFFVVLGVAQLAWANFHNRKTSRQLYYAGLFLTGGMIILWAITRVVTQPFHGHPGSVDLEGILVKTAELIGLVGLVQTAAKGKVKGISKATFASMLGSAILISVATGFMTYGVAVAAEYVMTPVSDHGEHSEGHEEGDQHEGEEHESEGEHSE